MDSVVPKPISTSLRSHFSFFKFPQKILSPKRASSSSSSSSSSIRVSLRTTPLNPDDDDDPKTPKSSFRAHPLKRILKSSGENWVSGSNGVRYLQSSGLGVALLSVTATARVKISPFVAQLAANPTFVSWLVAWLVAQSVKVVLNFFVERKWDLRILFASGGMPSSHSALCTALSTSVALCHGVADSLFPVCLGFTLIVMYDAIGVRRHAGMQAEVRNLSYMHTHTYIYRIPADTCLETYNTSYLELVT